MATKEDKTGRTHIRFIGSNDPTENSACAVFGKNFYRGKWVPLTNLNGTNPDKTPLTPEQLKKLMGNPAFQVGDGEDSPIPGGDPEAMVVEEA